MLIWHWKLLNAVRTQMVELRRPAELINEISRYCETLIREGDEV